MTSSMALCVLALDLFTSSNSTNTTDNTVRNSQINTQRRLDASSLVTIMNQYIANNSGRLPSINGDAEVKTLSGYFDDLKDINGQPYKVQFVATADASKIRGGTDYLNVFYYSDCDSDGNLVSSSSKRSFVVLYANTGSTGYSCVGGSN